MKKTIYYILCAGLCGLVVLFGYKYFKSIAFKNEKKAVNEKVEKIKAVHQLATAEEPLRFLLDDYRKELNNNDVKGKITIKSLGIDSLIMQSDNNTFYLSHLENKSKNVIGSIMLDFRTDLINDKINVIYGHSSTEYNTPFSKLESYDDYEFYKNNRIIEITTDEGIDEYELFSVIRLDKKSVNHAKVAFGTDEEYLAHLKWLQDLSIHNSDEVELTTEDKILVIQTCSQKNRSKFYILVLRKDGK